MINAPCNYLMKPASTQSIKEKHKPPQEEKELKIIPPISK